MRIITAYMPSTADARIRLFSRFTFSYLLGELQGARVLQLLHLLLLATIVWIHCSVVIELIECEEVFGDFQRIDKSNLYETSIQSPIILKSLCGRRAMAVLHLGGPPLVNFQISLLSPSSSPLFNPQTDFLCSSSTRFRPRGAKSAAMVEPRCSSSDMTGTRGGQIQRQVLSNAQRTKLNPSSDRSFYSSPRLVTHVDDQFLNTLTNVYRQRIPENAEVLDLMSSWVSHLPGISHHTNFHMFDDTPAGIGLVILLMLFIQLWGSLWFYRLTTWSLVDE